MKNSDPNQIFDTIKKDVPDYFRNITDSPFFYKTGRELVTKADTDLNRIITGLIKIAFPEHNIISEEGNGNISSSEYCWYIDPIDNSVGFLAGETEISVSVSLKKGKEHIRSMVINPRTDEIFEAYDCKGMLNGTLIKTYKGRLKDMTRGISTCPFVTKTRIGLAKDVLGRIFENRLPLRISGGSALDLCRVAEGKSFAHVCLGAHNWDVEAGLHILQNAGGAVEILEIFPERGAIAFIGASGIEVLNELKQILEL